MQKICLNCEKPFEPHKRQTEKLMDKQIYCSEKCGQIYLNSNRYKPLDKYYIPSKYEPLDKVSDGSIFKYNFTWKYN